MCWIGLIGDRDVFHLTPSLILWKAREVNIQKRGDCCRPERLAFLVNCFRVSGQNLVYPLEKFLGAERLGDIVFHFGDA